MSSLTGELMRALALLAPIGLGLTLVVLLILRHLPGVAGLPPQAGALVGGLGVALTGVAVAVRLSQRGVQRHCAQLRETLEHERTRHERETRRYREIYEAALEGLFTSTLDGRILDCNPALARILGDDDAAALIARCPQGWLDLLVNPQVHPRLIQTLLSDGMAQDMAVEVIRQGGGTVWLSLSVRLVRNEAGEPLAVRGSADDITQRRRSEVALRLAKEQSEFASRSKTEFLANMSHELRTPLNAIIGFSDIIAGQGLGPIGNPVYAEYARDIHDSGHMLLDLINDILDLSKIEAGKRQLNEHVVDVATVFASCHRMMIERAIRAGVNLVVRTPGPLPRLYADEVAVKQMLSNLLTNAVKFTPKGGTVTLTAWQPDETAPDSGNDAAHWTSCCGSWERTGLVMAVRDTGIGMRPEDIGRAMEPFQQIENPLTRSAGGAGLGLPLVRALIDLHAGRLDIASTPGVGTEVRLLMPSSRVLTGDDRHSDASLGDDGAWARTTP